MRFTKAFAQQPPGWILAEMALALLVIGFVDFVSDYKLRLLPFYCALIFVASWFCGKRVGLLAGIVAAIVSLSADWLHKDPDLRGWREPWEIARHLGACLVVALVGAALRSKSDTATARIALLERAQRLEREIVNVSEAEQRRIGQDLHDGICQHLAALSCAATSLRDDLRKLGLRGEAVTAEDLASQLRDAVVQTRDLSHGLAPAHVSQVGLALALESLAQSVSRLQDVSCTFQARGPALDCDERTATHFYRIAQEAINNATRHGRAKNLTISLETIGERMSLAISDDGIGISEPNSNGMGLAVMRYRARLNGGELRIERREQGGTRVSCTARINQPQTEPHEIAEA